MSHLTSTTHQTNLFGTDLLQQPDAGDPLLQLLNTTRLVSRSATKGHSLEGWLRVIKIPACAEPHAGCCGEG